MKRGFGRSLPAAALLLAYPAAAGAAARGALGGGSDLSVSLWRIVAAIFVCSLAALLLALLLRAREATGSLAKLVQPLAIRTRAIDVIETRRLSPHADISVVQHNGREYLILLMAGAANILSVAPVAVRGEQDGVAE